MTLRSTLVAAALALSLTSCGNSDPSVEWTGTVEQDIDNLTGEPTGYYTTWGPSVSVSVHGRPTTVSVGYFCIQEGADGLAVRMAVPLDSVRLRMQFATAAPNTRLAVDRVPIDWDFEHYFTDSTAAVLASPVRTPVPEPPSLYELRTQGRTAYIGWEPYRDQVVELVATADSMGFDLGDIGSTVVRFPVGNISTAINAVRFWCPIHEMVDSLNAARNGVLALADSIRGQQQAREAVQRARYAEERAEAERREAARREQAERARAEAEHREAARREEAQRLQVDIRETEPARAYAQAALTPDVSDLLSDAMGLSFSGHKRTFLAVARLLDMVPVATRDDIARVCRADIEAVMRRLHPSQNTQTALRQGCSLILRQ